MIAGLGMVTLATVPFVVVQQSFQKVKVISLYRLHGYLCLLELNTEVRESGQKKVLKLWRLLRHKHHDYNSCGPVWLTA